MRVIDDGPVYGLSRLDGSGEEVLTFVKRCGEGYPGNVGSHAGTNMQEVLRALLHRVKYLDRQIHCSANNDVIEALRDALFSLEVRAAQRHNRVDPIYGEDLELRSTCPTCGHIGCGSGCSRTARTEEGL